MNNLKYFKNFCRERSWNYNRRFLAFLISFNATCVIFFVEIVIVDSLNSRFWPSNSFSFPVNLKKSRQICDYYSLFRNDPYFGQIPFSQPYPFFKMAVTLPTDNSRNPTSKITKYFVQGRSVFFSKLKIKKDHF